mgnify:CR=1 FL=1
MENAFIYFLLRFAVQNRTNGLPRCSMIKARPCLHNPSIRLTSNQIHKEFPTHFYYQMCRFHESICQPTTKTYHLTLNPKLNITGTSSNGESTIKENIKTDLFKVLRHFSGYEQKLWTQTIIYDTSLQKKLDFHFTTQSRPNPNIDLHLPKKKKFWIKINQS